VTGASEPPSTTPVKSSAKADCDYLFKLILIGDSGVGKSCLLQRFCGETQVAETHVSTIGVDFRFRFVNIDKKIVKLQIWDTAGQEKFRTITNAYYRGADGVILTYDVTNAESFEHIEEWLSDVERFAESGIAKLLVGNKADLKDERQITFEEALKKAEQSGMPFVETSAREGDGVESAFLQLTKTLIKKVTNDRAPTPASPIAPSLDLNQPAAPPKKETCC